MYVSVHVPLRLYFNPLKLFNFDLNPDLDLAFHFNADHDQYPAFKNNTDPDPDPQSGLVGELSVGIRT